MNMIFHHLNMDKISILFYAFGASIIIAPSPRIAQRKLDECHRSQRTAWLV